ncbi:acyl-CoA dehydrogenase family protein [Kutzneria sp. 744]|uniref:acyl-CoA dehydrogenase family protein n=1 Tax=Kutzneria sp. (strain 744) TaxID=345341 RepID=UPI00015D3A71|nr:acyl-CoA dehydrogenase family protein [Kutzneria sp. 744]ABV56602.1 acyl-CoA-like dehydrogenase [Kutzneria sp. 744]EWM18626.1 long-chain-acyl-CoA dehydrogenase [Kutzneria sp. 744]
MREEILADEHRDFRELVRTFIARRIAPHYAAWERRGVADREVWRAAGAAGLLGIDMPAEHGGGGSDDYRFQAILSEELARAGTYAPCLPLHNEIVGSYLRTLATAEQQRRWLPGFCSGDLVTALAITEPDAGSDISAMRTTAVGRDGGWQLNGSKTFVSNGHSADLYLVVALTPTDTRTAAPARGTSASMLVVEADRAGVKRGRLIDKIGMKALDTSELFFDDVAVPARNLLGRPGRAFGYLMRNLVQERMWIGISALAAAERVLAETLEYVGKRSVFGMAVGQHQSNRHHLAELATAVEVARSHCDRAILAYNDRRLSAEDAAMVKWWNTELCQQVVTQCLQLHGGYGFVRESVVARAYLDTRVQTIYGGTTEVMKEIISHSLI